MGLVQQSLVVLLPAVWLSSLLIIFQLSKSSGGSGFLDFAYLGYMFKRIDPYMWSSLGVAFAIGFSVIGAAWCVLLGRRLRPFPFFERAAPWICRRSQTSDPWARQSAWEQGRRCCSRPAPHFRNMQGYFHHRFVARRRCREGSEDHLEESDQVRRPPEQTVS